MQKWKTNNFSCIEKFESRFLLWLWNYPFLNNKGSYLSLIKGKKVILCMYLFLSLLSFLKSDVTPTFPDLSFGFEIYAYLGQAAYQNSVIAVAVTGLLVEQILCENWTLEW